MSNQKEELGYFERAKLVADLKDRLSGFGSTVEIAIKGFSKELELVQPKQDDQNPEWLLRLKVQQSSFMIVRKFGRTSITLFGTDMFGNETKQRVYLEDISVAGEEKVPVTKNDLLTTEKEFEVLSTIRTNLGLEDADSIDITQVKPTSLTERSLKGVLSSIAKKGFVEQKNSSVSITRSGEQAFELHKQFLLQ